jgi:hypothetical protein
VGAEQNGQEIVLLFKEKCIIVVSVELSISSIIASSKSSNFVVKSFIGIANILSYFWFVVNLLYKKC